MTSGVFVSGGGEALSQLYVVDLENLPSYQETELLYSKVDGAVSPEETGPIPKRQSVCWPLFFLPFHWLSVCLPRRGRQSSIQRCDGIIVNLFFVFNHSHDSIYKQ